MEKCLTIDDPPLGIGLALLSALLGAFGFNALKLAHHDTPYAGVTGAFFLVAAFILYYTALTYAGELIITPVLCAVIPINYVTALIINNESGAKLVTVQIVIGCLLMIAGWLPMKCINTDTLHWPRAVIFAAILSCIMLFFAINIVYIISSQSSQMTLLLFSEAFLTGAMQSLSGVMARVIKEKASMMPLIAIIIVFTIGQFIIINMAMKQFNVINFVPIYIGTWIICDVLSGGLIFLEFAVFDMTHLLIYVFGMVITLVAMVFVARDHKYELLESQEI